MAKTKSSIIDLYMNWTLEHGAPPANVYKFCKENKLTETEFYQQYSSLNVLAKSVFSAFFKHTISMLEKEAAYATYGPKEKLLSFYYTFFEILTANRSYILQELPASLSDLKKLDQLTSLRKEFKHFTNEIFAEHISSEVKNVQKVKAITFEEGTWLQLLLIMAFWIKDESAGFEKTDIFIEKALTATFDLVDNTPINSILDLGKFLFKEVAA